MNRQSKSATKSLVLMLRYDLDDEVNIQLKRFGYAGERWRSVERLPHIYQDKETVLEPKRRSPCAMPLWMNLAP